MNKSSSIININGSQYDSVSGQLVGAAKKVANQVSTPVGGMVDGIVKQSSTIKNQASQKINNLNGENTRIKYRSHPSDHQAHNVHQKAQRSQTLMRAAVSKPNTLKQKSPSLKHKIASSGFNPARVVRAKSVDKHSKVDHFGSPSAKKTHKTEASQKALIHRPMASQAQMEVSRPLPSMITSASHHKLERLLDHALTHADAHKQQLEMQQGSNHFWRRIKTAPKLLSVGAGLLIIALLVGFFAWQNIPQVSVRIAATRANVNASVPTYAPSGYSFAAPVRSSGSAVTIQFQSEHDATKSYSIEQKKSNWDSSSLEANVIPKNAQVQTSDVHGTTVYIYGEENHAAWVDRGVLHVLNDQADLSSEQILKIADSM